MKFSADQAYATMYAFLEHRFRTTGSDELGSLLGDLSLLPDGAPADPAIAADWAAARSKTMRGEADLRMELSDAMSPTIFRDGAFRFQSGAGWPWRSLLKRVRQLVAEGSVRIADHATVAAVSEKCFALLGSSLALGAAEPKHYRPRSGMATANNAELLAL